MASEREAFIRFKHKHPNEIYNHIRNNNFQFFAENKRTGKKELDDLIANCTHYEPKLRPKIADVLK